MPVFTNTDAHAEAPARRRMAPLVVIIPTKNRPDDLEATIKSLLAQSVLPRQTIIVDQSPTEESKKRVETLFRDSNVPGCPRIELTYIHDPRIGGAAEAKNCAMDRARAEFALFLDDDVVMESNFIEVILDSFAQHPQVDGVSGIITNYNPPAFVFRAWTRLFTCGPFWDDRQPIYWKASRMPANRLIPITRFGAGLMAFRSTAIEHVRFDDRLHGVPGGEDVDFCMRLKPGTKLMIAPGARLLHKHTPTARVEEHWLYRHARTNRYLYIRNWKHGFRNRVAYCWLNVGYALAATASCAWRRSLSPWGLVLKARKDAEVLLGLAE